MDLREQLQQTLGWSYTLERELGGGGMARVFVATETRLRRNVVVKIMSPETATDVSGERFQREIQVAASLQQANIVPILSAGDLDGVPYYTMPYVEGESLRTLLLTRGQLAIDEVVSILRDVARALSYAHAHGVVHRDIKPDNVLLSHGAAVVTDFGIAKAISASRTAPGNPTLTQAGAAIGTPPYMPPEQVASEAVIDHRADVYAFGCMAYELLTGRPPFVDPSVQRVLAAHLTESPRPVRDLRPAIPPSLASLVMRCLEKRPEDRPASANDILNTLGLMPGATADAASDGIGNRASRRRRLALGAGAIVFTILLAVGTWWRGRHSMSTREDRSVVVLPLTNLSRDKANDYFGVGLAEEITDALNKAGLRVIGRSSAGTLVEKGLDAREIARRLAVAYVLEGSVQQVGDSGRITMSLMSVKDGTVLWSDKYDEPFSNVFAVQDSIAHSVASALKVRLSGGASATLVRTETNAEAHALYLQGFYEWNRRTAEALRQAIDLFERAVRRDSMYARAYAGIGMAKVVLPIYDDVPTDSMLSSAVDAAHHALRLDSTLAEAHAVLGYASATKFENEAAETSLQTSSRLDSNFATTHYWHALLLAHLGRDAASMREGQRARELDPAALVIQTVFATELYAERQYAAAEASDSAVLAFEPSFKIALLLRGRMLIEQRRFDEAIALLEPLSRQPNVRSSEKIGLLAYAYARAGRAREAREALARLPRDPRISAAGDVAVALDALGERDSAVAVFRTAVAQHDPWILPLGRSAPYDGLRRDPRLAQLFAKIESPR